eukprot:7377626-Prymnesium_polylepis.1
MSSDAQTLERAFELYCEPRTEPAPPPWLLQRLMTISWSVSSQRKLASKGNIARSRRQVSCYYALTAWLQRQRPAPLHICETGFNAGHSATTFLSATRRDSRYYGFDLGDVVLTIGDSNRTAPAFFAAIDEEFRCDLLSVDGDHSLGGVSNDWRNFKRHLRADAPVLLDDLSWWHDAFRPGKAHFAPDLHLVGCVSLPGFADDEESLRPTYLQSSANAAVRSPTRSRRVMGSASPGARTNRIDGDTTGSSGTRLVTQRERALT